MMPKFFFFVIFALALSALPSFSQNENEEMSPEEWEYLRDEYAVKVIKLMSLRDSLINQIDSLTGIANAREEESGKCETALLELVGSTKTELVEFRRKFEETEKKINNRNSSPEDIRSSYYDEISSSKLLCLPEFSDRFKALKNKFQPGTPQEKQIQYTGSTYLVVKGDCLWSISEMKLGSASLWPVIWDVNKAGVLNKDSLTSMQQSIHNPNLIYPGQVIRIPALNEAQKKLKEARMNLRREWYRRHR